MSESWLQKPQPRLGQGGLLFLLVAAAWIMPLSFDMYTPAIPHMAQNLGTTKSLINLTMVGYYFFFAIGLLVSGPLSDRIGRKPVILIGLGMNAIGAFLCALSTQVWFLIGARIIQALGAGAADAMTISIVKDAFKEEKRQNAISFIQLMLIIGPVIAPVLGAFIVSVSTWHVTFISLGALGIICFIVALFFEETLDKKDRVSGKGTSIIGQFVDVLKRPGFAWFLIIFTMFDLGFMAYVAVASYVYVSYFELSEMAYGLFFGITALFSMLGPFAWQFASRWINERKFMSILMIVAILAGIAMLVVGHISAILFCIPMLIFAVMESSSRPLTVNILLSQHEGDTGSTSSVINFMYTLVGCLGMVVVHLPFPDFITALASVLIACMLVSIVLWIALLRSDVKIKGISKE